MCGKNILHCIQATATAQHNFSHIQTFFFYLFVVILFDNNYLFFFLSEGINIDILFKSMAKSLR